MFDVNLEEVEVTLSFMRWLDGKGLVKDAKVKGVRGVVGELQSCTPSVLVDRQIDALSGGTQANSCNQQTTDTLLIREILSSSRCK